VSHMCSLRWRGKDAIKFVESVTVADVHGLAMHSGTLSVIPLENGGILDDTMITKTSDAQVSLSLLSTRVTERSVCLCCLCVSLVVRVSVAIVVCVSERLYPTPTRP
jgi:glycine cleavage system aminomethyltransferase T